MVISKKYLPESCSFHFEIVFILQMIQLTNHMYMAMLIKDLILIES